jgi:serine protease Do
VSDDGVERGPCATCGEAIPLEAVSCRYCGATALVDVWSTSGIADGRARYQAARALATLGKPIASFNTVAEALKAPRRVLAHQVTRALALRMTAIVEANGGSAQPETARPSRLDGGLRSLTRVAGLVAFTLLLVGSVWWAVRGPDPLAPIQVRAGAAPKTGQPDGAGAEAARGRLEGQALDGTVALSCGGRSGAGFFVAEDLVLTNAHVTCGLPETLKVQTRGGGLGTANAVSLDERRDLALLRVKGVKGRVLGLGDAGTLKEGDPLVLVGSPVGLDFSLNRGTVSSVARPILGVAYIQIAAGVNPGNSGGPLLDADGRVVGVVTMKRADAENIGLAVPINYAFTGDNAMLPAPERATASAGFATMLEGASRDEQETLAKVAGTPLLPRLRAVRSLGGNRLEVLVLRPSRFAPPGETLSFRVVAGERLLCTSSPYVADWKAVDGASTDALSPLVREWLKEYNMGFQVYAGRAEINLEACYGAARDLRGKVVLELDGAESGHDRVPIY